MLAPPSHVLQCISHRLSSRVNLVLPCAGPHSVWPRLELCPSIWLIHGSPTEHRWMNYFVIMVLSVVLVCDVWACVCVCVMCGPVCVCEMCGPVCVCVSVCLCIWFDIQILFLPISCQNWLRDSLLSATMRACKNSTEATAQGICSTILLCLNKHLNYK